MKPMEYYALIYDLVPDHPTRRGAYRDDHLRLLREANARGDLVMAGAFADPMDRGLLIFRVRDRAVVEDFARKDPYVINGLVPRWEVRKWTVVVGNEPSAR
jgi:uncharacterized protein YciI